MATGPDHYLEAERMRAAADEWADADLGWKANLTAQERINQRLADLADAQVHATLALAAATAMAGRTSNVTHVSGMHEVDFETWDRVAGVQDDEDDNGADIPDDDDQYGDENYFSRAQLDGEACTVCSGEFLEGQPTVQSGYDFIEGQLFAHAACVESEA